MKPIEKVYPRRSDEDYFSEYDYTPMLESIGDIVVRVDETDYQGDSIVLFKRDDSWGVLIFGWGSCSGCDALQSCSSYDELNELREDLLRNIDWFYSVESLLEHLEDHKKQETEWYYHTELWGNFRSLVQDFFS